jgi:hypothetical protein
VGTGALIFAIAMGLGYSWINSIIFLIGVVMVISRLFNEIESMKSLNVST